MSDKPQQFNNDGDGKPKGEIVHYSEEYFYQGIIPHPSMVEDYERIMKGAANRIFVMTEKEQESRHKLGRWNLLLFHAGRLLGLLFAFLVAILTIGGGIFLLYFDKSITGMVTMLAGIASLVGVFIAREHRKKGKDKEKDS